MMPWWAWAALWALLLAVGLWAYSRHCCRLKRQDEADEHREGIGG